MKTEEQLLQQLAALCASKECCLQELRKRLAKSDLPEEAQARILQQLQAERFVDEARFARCFTADKFRLNRWGRIRINYELTQKGIPSGIRQEALAGIDEEQYRETLTDLLLAKKKTTQAKHTGELFQKLLRFAASRGYESAITYDCLHTIINSSENEDFEIPDMD